MTKDELIERHVHYLGSDLLASVCASGDYVPWPAAMVEECARLAGWIPAAEFDPETAAGFVCIGQWGLHASAPDRPDDFSDDGSPVRVPSVGWVPARELLSGNGHFLGEIRFVRMDGTLPTNISDAVGWKCLAARHALLPATALFEYWIVSNEIVPLLKEKGERVVRAGGVPFWARLRDSGPLAHDEALESIAKEEARREMRCFSAQAPGNE